MPAPPALDSRQRRFSTRRIRVLYGVLARLPWPWGEEIFARYIVFTGFVGTRRIRRALAWISAQRIAGLRRWRLVRTICFNSGRFEARSGLMGVRDPETLGRLFTIRGESHLGGAEGGVILLGCHLGPRGSWLGLRVAGHRLTWVGMRSLVGLWSPVIRDRFLDGHADLFFSREPHDAIRALHRARARLVAGDTICINADGRGEPAFSIPVPGGSVRVQGGWLALRRATGATVLPVLSHMEGRIQVVTVHPPLPRPIGDRAADLEACRRALEEIVTDYVRRFPEQCVTFLLSLPDPARHDGDGFSNQ